MSYDKRKILLLTVTFIILLSVGVTVYLVQQKTRLVPRASETDLYQTATTSFCVPPYFSSMIDEEEVSTSYVCGSSPAVTPSQGLSGKETTTAALAGTDSPTEANVRLPALQMYQADSFTGTASVNYPLEVYPGRGGLTPNLSLAYSSGTVESMRLGDPNQWNQGASNESEAGDIGLGWSLSGISGIHRDTQTGLFSLSLNGSHFELIEAKREIVDFPGCALASSSSLCSTDGIKATYRTKPDSFLKIEHVRPRYMEESDCLNDQNKTEAFDGTNDDIQNGKYRKGAAWDADNCNGTFKAGNYISYQEFAKTLTKHLRSDWDNQNWYVWDKTGTKYAFGIETNFNQVNPDDPNAYSNSYFWRKHEGITAYFKLYYYYPLKEIQDLQNNLVNFAYTSEFKHTVCKKVSQEVPYLDAWYPRKTRIKTITYNGKEAEIRFITKGNRQDDEDINGRDKSCHQNIWSDNRISAIEVYFRGNLIRKYNINDTYLERKNVYDSNDILGKFLTVDSIELQDASGKYFEVNSKFEYYSNVDDNGYLLLKKASNIPNQPNQSIAALDSSSAISWVEYDYNSKDKDAGDFFVMFEQDEKWDFAMKTNYFRSVKEKRVVYKNGDGQPNDTVKYTYEYPPLPRTAGFGPDNYSLVAQGNVYQDRDGNRYYVNFELKGHRKTDVTQYKKNSNDIELKTETAFNIGEPYREGEWKAHSFYPYLGSPRRTVVRDSKNQIKSVSETKYRVFLPYAGFPANLPPVEPEAGNWSNPPVRNYQAYLADASDLNWWRTRGSNNANQWHRLYDAFFSYPSETRSCSLDGEKGVGSKSVSYSDKQFQGDQQWGNMTTGASYYVSGCTVNDSTGEISFISTPLPYSVSQTDYQGFDRVDSQGRVKYIASRATGSNSYLCQDGSGEEVADSVAIDIDGQGAVCNQPKRIGTSWNIYDNAAYPWSGVGSQEGQTLPENVRNLVTKTVASYTFPQASYGAGRRFEEWNNQNFNNGKPWQTIQQSFTYDPYGHVLTSTSYGNYGELTYNGTAASWGSWSPLSPPSDARTTTTAYYNNGALGPFVKTVANHLGQTVTTTYDFQLGKGNLGLPVQVVDANGAMSVTAYDSFGRVLRSCSPTEQVNGECPDDKAMVKYQYFFADQGVPFAVQTAIRDDPRLASSQPGCNFSNADINQDCKVNLFDVVKVGSCFGASPEGECARADITKDGVINKADTDCVSQYYDQICSPSYLYSWSFYNGLNQVIQSQTEQKNNKEIITVVDTVYNGQGLVEKQSLPYEEKNGGTFKPQRLNTKVITYQYDSLGRNVEKTNTDGTKIAYTYTTEEGDFGPTEDNPHRHFVAAKNEATNAKGQRKTSFSNPLGRLVEVREYLNGQTLKTTYKYDSRGLLTDVYDAKNQENTQYKTHITYNQAGQKTAIDDPDLGIWGYEYDPLGNLYKTTDAREIVKVTNYDFLNRPSMRYYELSPNAGEEARRVTGINTYTLYAYDNCPQGKGRLCRLDYGKWNGPGTGQNALQIDNFTYDIKGRTIAQKKTLVKNDPTDGGEYLPLDSNTVDFVTETEYDTMDRPRIVRYPDQGKEQVAYNYDDAGQLYGVEGKDRYLANALYNELGLPTEEYHGNNSKTIYKYWGEDQNDPANKLNYRLKLIEVTKGQDFPRNKANCSDSSNENELLKICYDYDPIGNIALQTYPQMAWAAAGDITQGSSKSRLVQYSYDVLNRLRGSAVKLADGTRDDTFGTSYTYDEVGNLLSKCEGKELIEPSYVLNDPNYPVHAPQTVNVGPARGVCTDALAAQTAGGTYEEGAAAQAQGFRFFGLEKLAGIVLSFLQTLKNLALPE